MLYIVMNQIQSFEESDHSLVNRYSGNAGTFDLSTCNEIHSFLYAY